jgi:hypothetical protein
VAQQAKSKGIVDFGRWSKPETEVRDTHGLPGIEPTKERLRHGKIVKAASIATEKEDAQPGIRMYRTQPPIERYASRGQITERQALAAADLRTDYEFGIIGLRDGSMYERAGAAGPASMSDAQLDAATRYREAQQAIGRRIAEVVIPIVVGNEAGGDVSAEGLAQIITQRRRESDKSSERGIDRKQIMGILKVGLDMLADHYEQCGDALHTSRYS